MSRRLPRPARGWIVLAIVVTAVGGGLLADRYLRERAPWRQSAWGDRAALALQRGHFYLSRGQHRRAIQAVSEIGSGSPDEAEARTIRGLAHAALEEVVPARQNLERAWRLRPTPTAAKVLAAIYLSAAESDRGLQMLRHASELDPTDFQPWYAMGEAGYLKLRRYEKAVEAFRQALKLRPGHLESRIGLLEALVKSHHPEEAEPVLKGVLQERPGDPRVLTLAAELSQEFGRHQDAERYLQQALSLEPDRHDALLLHARLQFRRGLTQEAASAAERACTLDPNDVAALNLLGAIQMTQGLKDQAAQTLARRREVERRNLEMETLLRTILQRPDDPELRWRLGQIAVAAGLKPLAIQSFQVALALAPDCEPARQGLVGLGFPATPPPPVSLSQRKGAHLNRPER
jgi:tetratricopeptide (TPR) repeat protein